MKSLIAIAFCCLVTLASTTLLAAEDPQAKSSGQPAATIFVDSKTFDDSLHETMAGGAQKIDISFAATPSANDIPERLDAWLYAVQQGGGEVDVQPTETARGVPTIAFSLALRAVKKVRQKRFYRPAQDYDAVLFYSPETGQIERVVLSRR